MEKSGIGKGGFKLLSVAAKASLFLLMQLFVIKQVSFVNFLCLDHTVVG